MAENEIKRQREEHLDDTSGPSREEDVAPRAPWNRSGAGLMDDPRDAELARLRKENEELRTPQKPTDGQKPSGDGGATH
jgi:hypothetical protein